MSSDDEIKNLMKLQPEDLRKQKAVEPKFARSKFDKDKLKEKKGDKVWVKCVVHNEPWANESPMKFWEDYEVSIEEAIMLDERRFCVILEPLKGE